MRSFLWVLAAVMAAGLVAGCAKKREEELPPMEPAEVQAPAAVEAVPVTIETPPPVPAKPKVPAPVIERPATRTPPAAPGADVPSTYTVQKGEGLMAIARKVYGDPAMWRKIHEANRDKIADPNKISAGLVLTIPPK